MNASSDRRMLLAALAMAIFLSACGGAGSGGSPGIDHPEDEVVLQVEHVGGLMIANGHLVNMPLVAVAGDGRVILPGAQVAIFPGPALPALQVRRLNADGLQGVLKAVADTGQFGADAAWRGAQNFVADAPDTVFTLTAEGRTVTVSVYALGLADELGGQGLSAEERTAHRVLQGLLDRLTGMDAWLADGAWADAAWQDYRAEALRLVVRNADADPPADEGMSEEVAWPLEGDPAAFGDATTLEGTRCGVVSGEDAEAWYAALETANQLTRFISGDHAYEVGVRPLLPGESRDCPQPA